MSEVCEKQHVTMRNAKLFVVNSTQVWRPGVAMYAGVLDAVVGQSLTVQWAAGHCCLDASCGRQAALDDGAEQTWQVTKIL